MILDPVATTDQYRIGVGFVTTQSTKTHAVYKDVSIKVSDGYQICHSPVHKTHALYNDMAKW